MDTTFWESLLQGSKLKRWFLVAPCVHNKDVLKHARKKASEMRKKNLPFLDPAFQAWVVTEDEFPEAKARLAQAGALTIDIVPDAVGDGDVSALTAAKTHFIANTDRKLGKVHPTKPSAEREVLRNEFLRFHLQSSNISTKLYREAPDLWTRLRSHLAVEEQTVAIESGLDDSQAGARLMGVRRKLASDIKENFTALSRATVDRLSWGTVAGWIGECTLDFKETA